MHVLLHQQKLIHPESFDTVDEAKTAAYEIYNDEMRMMKRCVDSLIKEGNVNE